MSIVYVIVCVFERLGLMRAHGIVCARGPNALHRKCVFPVGSTHTKRVYVFYHYGCIASYMRGGMKLEDRPLLIIQTLSKQFSSTNPADPAASSGTLPQHMVTTSNYLPSLPSHNSGGIVQGITVRSTHFFKAIGAGLKTIVGGEVKTWSKMCSDTRAQALERMLEQATQLGAKGVIGMRYDSNQVSAGLVEVLAYGTAVFDTPVPRVSDDVCISTHVFHIAYHGLQWHTCRRFGS